MYREVNIDELLRERYLKNFILAKNFNENELFEIAEKLKNKTENISEAFVLNGRSVEYYPSFESIRMPPRFVVSHGQLASITDGLIFPQDEPIILLITNFYSLKKEDQDFYLGRICKKEVNDVYPRYYLHEDSIVILDLGDEIEIPEISYKLRVLELENK